MGFSWTLSPLRLLRHEPIVMTEEELIKRVAELESENELLQMEIERLQTPPEKRVRDPAWEKAGEMMRQDIKARMSGGKTYDEALSELADEAKARLKARAAAKA